MNQMRKLFVFALVLGSFVLLSAQNVWAVTNHTAAKQAILMDYDTGMVLFEKNADERMPTSSMSKVMTMLVVFDALNDGRLRMDTTLPVSQKAWKKGGSKMFVEVGSRVAVEDLIRGVVIQSGNDATIVLAEGLAGTEEAFAEALNQKAVEIGMSDSNFMNASGWPDPNHYSTARDLASMARYLLMNHPEYYKYFSETEYTYNDIKQRNRNPLLYRDLADGIKTGHTENGGYGLIASGQRYGRRVILVVNGLPSEKARAQEGARLLEWGLKGFENIDIFASGETMDNAAVIMGKAKQVPLVTDTDLKISLPKAGKKELKVDIEYEGPLEAPIKAGDQIGKIMVQIPNMKTTEFPLYAGDNIERLGLVSGVIQKLKLFLFGKAELE